MTGQAKTPLAVSQYLKHILLPVGVELDTTTQLLSLFIIVDLDDKILFKRSFWGNFFPLQVDSH